MPQKTTDRSRESIRRKRAQVYTRNRCVVQKAKSVPCSDCDVSYPFYVMDFDHVRGIKLFNIAFYLNKSLKMINEEIAKCDVVCANCHREREHRRKLLGLPATL
jgi:hypothetical protein